MSWVSHSMSLISTRGFWPFSGWFHDQDPSPRHFRRLAHENRDHPRSDAMGTYAHLSDQWTLIYDQPLVLNQR